MTAFISLLKLQLKQQFRPRRGQRHGALVYVLLPIAFLPLCYLLLQFFSALTQLGMQLHAPGIGLELAILVSMLAGVMLGLTYIVSSFYYAKDLPLLIPLPIKPESVLYAKFVLILLGELVSVAIIYVPAVIGYAIAAGPGPSFWLLALLVLVALPIIPLSLASLVAMALMAATNGRASRDGLRVALSLFIIALYMGFQVMTRSLLQSGAGSSFTSAGAAAVQRMLAHGGLLDLIGRYFPPSVWATRTMLADWPSALLFLGVTVAIAVILAAAARRFFYRGLVGGDERPSRRKAMSEQTLRASTARVSSAAMAVFRREVRQLNRTPVFLMQALMPAIMAPVYLLMPLLSGGGFVSLRSMAGAYGSAFILGAVGFTQFMLALSPLAATAFSREGRSFWLSRSLPLSGRDQTRGKLLHSLLMSGLYIVLFAALIAVLIRPAPWQLLLFVVANALGATVSAGIGLHIDLASPRLNWVEPQQAFKGNYNSLITLLLLAVVLGVSAVIAGLLFRFGPVVGYLAGLITLAAAAVAASSEVMAYADRRYDQIDV